MGETVAPAPPRAQVRGLPATSALVHDARVTARRTAWLLVYRNDGSAGYVAHWLDFDLVAAGRDPAHALETALAVATWRLERDRAGPKTYVPAPRSEWRRLEQVLEQGGVVGDLASLPPQTIREIDAVAVNYIIEMGPAKPAPEGEPPDAPAEAVAPIRPVVMFVALGSRKR